jgi:hypothetical protein
MNSCKECAKLWDKPLPPQYGCNDCYDLLRTHYKKLEANLKVAVEFIEEMDKLALENKWTQVHFKTEDLLFKIKGEK